MTNFVLYRAEASLAYSLRGAMASGQVVRLVLSDRCDGVRLNEEGDRILEGVVTKVAATDAFCIVQGRHVPLAEILTLVRPHFTQAAASDPREPDV